MNDLPLDLPPSVTERLRVERERIEGGAFSGALGVPEMLLARQSGYRVLAPVMGASVFQFGGQREFANWRDINWRDADAPGWRFELTAYTGALRGAFTSALERLRAQASELGADGVVGVQIKFVKPRQLNGDQIEFIINGTAVQNTETAVQTIGDGGPFTSNLSAQDTWKLERTGYAPRAFVMESCALLQALSGATRAFIMGSTGPGDLNYEFVDYTEAIYVARETLMERLETCAQRAGASGILNVQIELEKHLKVDPKLPGVNADTPHQILALIAQGTAVRPLGRAENYRVSAVAPL